jgi:hypothetical protein
MATEAGRVFWLRKDEDDGKIYPSFGRINSSSLAQYGTPLLITSEKDAIKYMNGEIDMVGLLIGVEEKLTAELARVGKLKDKAILERKAEPANGGGRTRKNKAKKRKNTRHRR